MAATGKWGRSVKISNLNSLRLSEKSDCADFLDWIVGQFGSNVALEVSKRCTSSGEPSTAFALETALKEVVGETEVDAAIASDKALSDEITSEPVQVDRYESVDVSDLMPEEEQTDCDGGGSIKDEH